MLASALKRWAARLLRTSARAARPTCCSAPACALASTRCALAGCRWCTTRAGLAGMPLPYLVALAPQAVQAGKAETVVVHTTWLDACQDTGLKVGPVARAASCRCSRGLPLDARRRRACS